MITLCCFQGLWNYFPNNLDGLKKKNQIIIIFLLFNIHAVFSWKALGYQHYRCSLNSKWMHPWCQPHWKLASTAFLKCSISNPSIQAKRISLAQSLAEVISKNANELWLWLFFFNKGNTHSCRSATYLISLVKLFIHIYSMWHKISLRSLETLMPGKSPVIKGC